MHVNIGEQIEFHTPLGESITARAHNLKSGQTSRDVDTFFLTITVEYEIFQLIDEQDLFNLLPQARNEFAIEKLEVHVPVEIELILKPVLASFLKRQNTSPDEAVRWLTQPSEDYDFLLSTESWLAYTIWQNVSLPDELADSGSLKIGYKTLWQISPEELTSTSMREVVQLFFLERGWDYEEVGENLFRINMREGETTWVCLVKVDTSRQFCLVYSVLPQLVPEAKRVDMAIHLIMTNYDLGVGSFEMDMDDGEVRFRTSVDVEGDRLSSALFERLMGMNISTVSQHISGLMAMLAD